jgi:two-component system alkaline phosphatase synthesis response regulator PhoP
MAGGELLGQPPARLQAVQSGRGCLVGRHDPSLAVEHDDRAVAAFHEALCSFLVHHSFTIELPFPNRGHTDNGTSMPKVLIVEDDDVIAQGMARHLGAAGFDPVSVGNGTQGLARLRYEKPDVCVLDLMLPGVDGWKLIETARNEGIGTPIVVVSARGTEHDRVHALEIGADDYLVKPFSMKELVARVRAASRRAIRREETPRGEPIEIEELRIDPLEVQAYVDDRSAELTPTEFRLLYQLALDRGRVVTRDELLQKLWGRRESHRDRTVDVFVRRLREKVDRQASVHTFIQTRYGVGYRLEPVPKAATNGASAR